MKHRLCPHPAGISQLISNSTAAFATARSAGDGGAVKIARRIHSYTFVRLSTIGAAGKTVNHAMHPAARHRSQLKNCPAPEATTEDGGPVKVTRAINRQVRISIFAIVIPEEAVDHLGRTRFHSRSSHLEYRYQEARHPAYQTPLTYPRRRTLPYRRNQFHG